jgi:hypothetical protein
MSIKLPPNSQRSFEDEKLEQSMAAAIHRCVCAMISVFVHIAFTSYSYHDLSLRSCLYVHQNILGNRDPLRQFYVQSDPA